MSASFQNFEAMCNYGGVMLHGRILKAASYIPDNHASILPTPVYAAVARAGSMLREDPDITLADRPITRSMQRGFEHDVASRALTNIINASIEPVPAKSWDTSFTCSGLPLVHRCSYAEKSFAAVFQQMLDPEAQEIDGYKPFGSQLLVGENDRIIAIRKVLGARTCLTLQGVTINSIPYPPGSLMRVNLRREHDGTRYRTFNNRRITTAPIESVSHLNFLRLSAFAVRPSERSAEFPRMFYKKPAEHNKLDTIKATWGLDRIRRLANTVLRQLPRIDN
jgi:hypothetical protein